MKKCILIVIDSLGVGAAPDAKKYGDEESNTFGNVSNTIRGNLESKIIQSRLLFQ